jgi:hypothetical protein
MAIPSEPFDSRPPRAYPERGNPMRVPAFYAAQAAEAASWPRVGERVSAVAAEGLLLETFANGEGLVGWDSGTRTRIPLGDLTRLSRVAR